MLHHPDALVILKYLIERLNERSSIYECDHINVHPPPSIANYMSHGCQCSIIPTTIMMVYKDDLILMAFSTAIDIATCTAATAIDWESLFNYAIYD